MPIYEYECTVCGRTQEHLLDFDHKEKVRCGFCGQIARRIISKIQHIWKEGQKPS
jgi:putative FmdB family regulatory protein